MTTATRLRPGVLSVDDLMLHPLFEGVPYKYLDWLRGGITRRLVQRGDVICRQGEYGDTAFVLLSGRYGISIRPAATADDRPRGLLARLGLGRKPRGLGDGYVTNDGNALIPARDLAPGRPAAPDLVVNGVKQVAVRTPEDVILGEMACMSNYPRSCTVTALADGEVWEVGRNVLFYMQRNRKTRAFLERAYRERALRTHLESVPLFAALSRPEQDALADALRPKIELVRVDPGQIIVREGEPADHFYLIRIGFVKVWRRPHGQDVVLNYLGPGSHFGEIALLAALEPAVAAKLAPGSPAGRRTASCTALDHVELVRVRGEHFQGMLELLPAVRAKLVARAVELLEKDAARSVPAAPTGGAPAPAPDSPLLRSFVDQGLYGARSLLVLDLTKCTRCDECTKACSDTHGGVSRLKREGLRFDKFLVASSCRSCHDPYCLIGCPVGSIRQDRAKGSIVIEDWCIGCGLCANNCPYGNIEMTPTGAGGATQARQATTCDLCRGQVGEGQETYCVYACPHDAAHRMLGAKLYDLIERKPG